MKTALVQLRVEVEDDATLTDVAALTKTFCHLDGERYAIACRAGKLASENVSVAVVSWAEPRR